MFGRKTAAEEADAILVRAAQERTKLSKALEYFGIASTEPVCGSDIVALHQLGQKLDKLLEMIGGEQ